MGKKYILSVPNFSEGRDINLIQQIVAPFKGVKGITLVDVESEYDFNRTVVTVLGEPEPLYKALIEMSGRAYDLIDMSKQKGSHPRIGSQDTIPLFPFKNIHIDEVVDMADRLGKDLFEKFKVPIYYSGLNSRIKEKSQVSFIRKGQYEGLRKLLEDGTDPQYKKRIPDLSQDNKLDKKKGATIVSASKEGLIAFNIFLATDNLDIAKKIAKSLRGPSGGFSSIRSVGIKFPEHEGVVVSMNMFDCKSTPIYRALEFVRTEALRYGVNISGTEIVGPIKLNYLLNSLEYYLQLENFKKEQILEYNLID